MLSRDVVDLDAGQRHVKRAGPPLTCVTGSMPAACVVDWNLFGNGIQTKELYCPFLSALAVPEMPPWMAGPSTSLP